MSESGNDRVLVAQLRRGDPEAQGWLLQRYGEPLVHFLIAAVQADPAEAEDIAIDTLYRAIERIDSFVERPGASPHSFRNWLFAIARNLARDHTRRRLPVTHVEDIERFAVPTDIEADMRLSAAALAVREALARLPENQRRTLLLHYDGMPLTRVADVLGVPPGTVRQWKQRGLAALAQLLRDHPAVAHLQPMKTTEGDAV